MDCGLLYINSNIPTVVEEVLIYPIRNPLENGGYVPSTPFLNVNRLSLTIKYLLH